MAEFAEGDSAIAAANLADDDTASAAAAERRDAREAFLRDLEPSIRGQLALRSEAADSEGCPTHLTDVDTDPRVLMDHDPRLRPRTPLGHIYELQEAALACNVVSDVHGASAAHWSARVSGLTVALVLLGLAGFLLALAADPGRSSGMASWLLQVGTLGAIAGCRDRCRGASRRDQGPGRAVREVTALLRQGRRRRRDGRL